MDSATSIEYLFDISKEIKHLYEKPIIFLTKVDLSSYIFDTMCAVRRALEDRNNTDVMDKIVDFHLKWLHSVAEIEKFKERVVVLPREELFEAINFTIDALVSRLKYFKRYMDKHISILPDLEHTNLLADIEIVEEMHKFAKQTLLDKLKCFGNYTDYAEFQLKVLVAADDLLLWFDQKCDSLSNHLSKYLKVNAPHISGDLTKSLQHIIDDLHTSKTPSALKIIEEITAKGQEICEMIRCTEEHGIEISKVMEKISVLDERIMRLEQEESSAAVMALKNKKDFLVKRLDSLENLKTTLKHIHDLTDIEIEGFNEEECACEDFYRLRIFNHILPPQERENLVQKLCNLWDVAVFGEKKSIISILSAADAKQEYTDDYGIFFIDEYSRKIYKQPDDGTLFQLNELNVLVPLADDENYIYFYDECGRYFLEPKTRERVYKAHALASEYMMDSAGLLHKVKEERDGVVYCYDSYGRYYTNNEGKHVYREADSVSEYENDGFGNLVRIRSHNDLFQLCPRDENISEDFKYLKQTVGHALRTCIADAILHQPADPIKYLAASLIKYRENIETNDIMKTEKEELRIEREVHLAEEQAAADKAALEAALLCQVECEASYDFNFQQYSPAEEDA